MLESFSNIIKVKELRTKLIITAALLVVVRLGVFIPTPGVDVARISEQLEQSASSNDPLSKLLNFADMFTGGALKGGAIFSLGIMPYITASIIFQLLVGVVPSLERLAREGPSGRKKINQYTRISTLFLCLIQGAMICSHMLGRRADGFLLPQTVISDMEFMFYGVTSLTIGTLFLMWLGEQIDEFGIGNGISLIIMINIISRLPMTLAMIQTDLDVGAVGAGGDITIPKLVVLVLLAVGMVVAVVLITLGQRRVPVQQAKATRGRRVYGGQRNYLPLRVNQSGVIPIIFAQAIIMLPQTIIGFLDPQMTRYLNYGAFWHTMLYVAFIVFFCYFYTAITFNPNEMADNLKQSGSYIPGIRPGKKTAEYLEKIMTRIALAGSIFLSFVAVAPMAVASLMNVRFGIAAFLGGTSLLIVVGVALDMVQRVESYLLMKNYDGLVKGGKPVRGR